LYQLNRLLEHLTFSNTIYKNTDLLQLAEPRILHPG